MTRGSSEFEMTLTFPIRSDKLSMSVSATSHLASVRSEFQQIDVYETDVFGRVLLLDGHVQLAEFDERAYHEALVWIPLLNVPDPKSALVVGGGDGGVIRELCKHPALERIDMVEIDSEVVRVSREFLPAVSDGAFEDPRVQLHIADAFEFVRNAKQSYDLIVIDCTDVYEEEDGELSERLFTTEFYQDVLARLSPNGMAVTQGDNPVFCPYSLEEISTLFGSVFPNIGSYWALVPSFGGVSAFCWGSRSTNLAADIPSIWPSVGLQYLHPTTYRFAQSELPFARLSQ